MDLTRLQLNWTNLGRTNPFWAILGSAESRGTEWDIEQFFATGLQTAVWVREHLDALGLAPERDRALDFGCGFGRLTQAMGDWFEEVVGVDIAEPMLEGARRCNRHGDRCRYLRNERPDLRMFEDQSFDLVTSLLVLQHIRPDYIEAYVAEFVRVLRPGGVAFFQAPTVHLLDGAHDGVATAAGESRTHADLACHCSVQPDRDEILAGEWTHYRVRLRNCGTRVWRAGPGPGQVRLARRWLLVPGRSTGPVTCVDLPGDVAPGQEVDVVIPFHAPAVHGEYRLSFLPVLGRHWVQTLACVPGHVQLRISPNAPDRRDAALASPAPTLTRPSASPSGPVADDEAIIEIHGVPTERIVTIVESAGGEVVDATANRWAGPGWLSAHYTVQKP